jgi:hypothetical protein
MADLQVIDNIQDGSDAVGVQGPGKTGQVPEDYSNLPPLLHQLGKAEKDRLVTEIREKKLDPAKLPTKLDSLWGDYQKLQSEVSKGIRVPAKDAPQADWDQYRKAIGVPLGPEGYALDKPKLPDGLTYNENLETWFRQKLHGAGVSQEQAKEIFADWNKLQIDAYQKAVKARNEAKAKTEKEETAAREKAAFEVLETLKAEFKDKFADEMAYMQKGKKTFMSQSLLEKVQAARLPSGITLDNDTEFVKAWANIGHKMADDTFVVPIEGGSAGNAPRKGLPKTPHGYAMEFPNMRKDSRYGVKEE